MASISLVGASALVLPQLVPRIETDLDLIFFLRGWFIAFHRRMLSPLTTWHLQNYWKEAGCRKIGNFYLAYSYSKLPKRFFTTCDYGVEYDFVRVANCVIPYLPKPWYSYHIWVRLRDSLEGGYWSVFAFMQRLTFARFYDRVTYRNGELTFWTRRNLYVVTYESLGCDPRVLLLVNDFTNCFLSRVGTSSPHYVNYFAYLDIVRCLIGIWHHAESHRD